MNKKYRTTIIAGNWKMNLLPGEVRNFTQELKAGLGKYRRTEVVLCPPSCMLGAAIDGVRGVKLCVGAQDVSARESGAFTGENSAAQLKELGCKYVIVGHSERRAYHGETDADVNAKAALALRRNLTPIICVGETLEQRERGVTEEHIRLQVKQALFGLDGEQARRCVIAYEPVWAIGTGKTATPEDAAAVCGLIRDVIRELFGAIISRSLSILYGGSMNETNAAELLARSDIDGGLIGGASLVPEKFLKILAASNVDS